MKRTLFFLLVAASACVAEPIDITNCPEPEKPRKSLAVTTSDAVLIQLPGGVAAVVQFTSIGEAQAIYRWRFRSSPTAATTDGSGRVFEDYDRVKQPDGSFRVTKRNKPEDLLIQAGDIWFEWSHKDTKSSWIYYCPDRATVTILPGADYASKP